MKRTTVILMLCLLCILAYAQRDSVVVREKKHNPNYELPVVHGFSINADLLSPVMNLVHGQVYGGECHMDINLYNRVFPTIEVGYADAVQNMGMNVTYKTHAPYVRLGVNYGLLKPFNKSGEHRSLDCYPYIGLRYAMAFMNYDIQNVVIEDHYWGTRDVKSFANPFVYSGWIEVVAGVRMNLVRGFTLGWSFRFRGLLHTTAADKVFVHYVPGYGKSDGSAFTFNYTIGYTFSIDERMANESKEKHR
ncbi:MAG: DUF6048 family protein [Paludibacteraceae bacterium]|nr:DUF6048 family protein [Paludibacteraceae bacterium]